MQSNFTYVASATISQYDLLTIDTSATSDLALYAKPASAGDAILGRSNSSVQAGEPINFTDLNIGKIITCIAGENISAGDHLAANNGKVVKGTAALIATESVSSGSKVRVCVVAELNEPPEEIEDLSITGDLELSETSTFTFGDCDLSAPALDGPIGTDVGQITYTVSPNSMTWKVGAICLMRCTVSGYQMAGATFAGTFFKPAYFSVANSTPESGYGRYVLLNKDAGSEHIVSGTWKLLSCGYKADDNDGFVLAQRVL